MDQLPKYHFSETKVLQRAIESRSLHRIKFLLSQGCDPNIACGPDSLRPLILACYIAADDKRVEVIEVLLQARAVPGLVDKSGRSALYHACWLGLDISTIDLLLQADDSDLTKADHLEGNTCLHVCAIFDRMETLKLLVRKMKKFGIDLNTNNNSGHTALSSAYLYNNMKCFEYLHSEGALPRHHWIDMCKILVHRPSLNRVIQDSIEARLTEEDITRPQLLPVGTSDLETSEPTHVTSSATIKTLLVKSTHKQCNIDLYRSNEDQRPIDNEWIETIQECRSQTRSNSPSLRFSTVVSITTCLRNIRLLSASKKRSSFRNPSLAKGTQ